MTAKRSFDAISTAMGEDTNSGSNPDYLYTVQLDDVSKAVAQRGGAGLHIQWNPSIGAGVFSGVHFIVRYGLWIRRLKFTGGAVYVGVTVGDALAAFAPSDLPPRVNLFYPQACNFFGAQQGANNLDGNPPFAPAVFVRSALGRLAAPLGPNNHPPLAAGEELTNVYVDSGRGIYVEAQTANTQIGVLMQATILSEDLA